MLYGVKYVSLVNYHRWVASGFSGGFEYLLDEESGTSTSGLAILTREDAIDRDM